MTTDSVQTTQRHLAGAAIAAVAALVYVNSLGNGLVWDDPIVLNRQLLAFKTVRDVIFTPRDIPQYAPDYYRPLTTLSYLVDHAIAGSAAWMFHLSVVLFHVAATYLVFRLGLLLFARTRMRLLAAGIGAAVFAVHPIHTESVAWGAGRSDVLACVFGLAAMVVYLSDAALSWQRTALAAVLAFLAVCAKETAFALLVMLFGTNLLLGRQVTTSAPLPARRGERRRQRQPASPRTSHAWHYVPFVAATLLYVGLRHLTLGAGFGQSKELDADVPLQVLGAVGLYLGKLVLPIRQSAYISDLPQSAVALAATALVLLAVAAAGVWSWRRGEPPLTFLLVWTALTLAPSLTIIAKIPAAPVAERYLYLPSVGFCLLVGYGAAQLLGRAPAPTTQVACSVLIGALLFAGAVATVRRNAVWRSNLTLWEDTAAKNTTDGLPMRSLGVTYLELGDPVKATDYLQQALHRRNDAIGRFTIYNNLGSIAMQRQQLTEAEQFYRKAQAIDPHAPDCLYNLGLINLTRALATDSEHDAEWKRVQADQARQLFQQAVQLSPLDPEIQVALGQAQSALGDAAAARAAYQRSLQLGLPPALQTSVQQKLTALQ